MNHLSNQNQIKYLKLLYLSSTTLSLFYIWKFSFEYQVSNYNFVLIPLYLLVFISPLSFKLTNNLTKVGLAIYIPTITLLGALIYISGGLEAPGALWISMIPVMAGLLFSYRGVIAGISLLGLFAGVYLLGHTFDWLPQLLVQKMNFQFERRLNMVTFCIFTSFVALFVVRTEKARHQELFHSRNEADGLVRIIIHDIASPLLNIRALLTKALQKQSNKNNPLTYSLQTISHQIDNMDEILSRVREMRAMAEGKLKANLTPSPIKDLVLDSIELLTPSAEKKGVYIVSTYNGEINPMILADEALFKNAILGNIFSNAIKFSQPGGRIDFRCIAQGETVTLEIQDYGVGMPAHILQNLFHIDQSTSRPGTAGEKGTGFGMVIVKEWIKKHGGQIHVKSHEHPSPSGSRGTTFRLIFPRHMAPAQKTDNVTKLKKAS